MFRAVLCSSSGGQIVWIQHMVSSLPMSGRGGRALQDHHDHSPQKIYRYYYVAYKNVLFYYAHTISVVLRSEKCVCVVINMRV